MSLFDPRLESGIAFEQPVQQPSAVGTALDFASGLVGVFAKASSSSSSGPSYAQQKDLALQQAFGDFTNQIDKAQALRVQGRTGQAEKIERQAAKTFAKLGGDLGSSEVESYYSATTGRPSEWLGSSAIEQQENEIRQSTEYREALLAQYANGGTGKSDKERDAGAFALLAKKAANKQLIELSSQEWDVNTQGAYLSLIKDQSDQLLGALELSIQQGVTPTPESIQLAKSKVDSFKREMTLARPRGVSSDQWAPIQEAFNVLDAQIETYETIDAKTNAGNKASIAKAYMQALTNTTDSVTMRYFLGNTSPDAIAQLGVFPVTEIRDTLVAMGKLETNLSAVLTPEGEAELDAEVSDKDVTVSLKEAKSIASTFRAEGILKPGQEDFFANGMLKAAANLEKMGTVDFTPAHAKELQAIFKGGHFEAAIKKLERTDPDLAEAIRKKFIKGMDAQYGAAVNAVMVRSRGFFKMEGGSFDIDIERIENVFPASRGGFVGQVVPAIQEAAKAYDGDIIAMIEDNASRVPTNPALKFFLGSDTSEFIQSQAFLVKTYRDAALTARNIRNRFKGIAPGIVEQSTSVPIPRISPEEPPAQPTLEFPEEGGQKESRLGGTRIGQNALRKIGNFFIPEAAAATNPSVYTDPRIEAPLSLIAMEESKGSYNAVNRGTKGNSIVGSDLNATRLGKPLTELTVGEVMDLQSIKDSDNPDRIFAFGKYQVIPDTFKQWVTSKDISESTVMSEEAQEALGEWLLLEKRPNVKKILESDATSEEKIKALRLELAKEWASLPVPEGAPDKKAGESYYGFGNKAKIASEDVDAALAAWLGIE